jgi:hypothetical protein
MSQKERFAKRIGQIGVEREEALADRLHEIPRVNFVHGYGFLGAYPRQQEYDLT